ncbi:glycosyltransferase 87 family protein [Streptomyces sp. NPDC004609]|uniref:glycosyltransferase 87 family protein n=1 Tax=Streptomyces sp. NPDC004609 TaxID=3364704 RepID=UPI0036C0E4EB
MTIRAITVLRDLRRWAVGHAALLLFCSLAAHVLTVAVTRPDMLDLRVYWTAAPRVLNGQLYDFRLFTSGSFPALPFTYPPFAALLFLPVSALPWAVAACLWQAVSVAALAVIVGCAGRLLPGGRLGRERIMLWAGGALWLEPVRHTLDLGQVNLILGALVLWGLTAARESVSRGAAVGVAAGVKLTPGISGAYLLLTRQWRAAAWAAGVFLGTVALAWALTARESSRYWRTLVVDPDRVGRVSSVRNQSLRGALSRSLGQDAGFGPVWLAAALALAALAGWALWAAARRRDPLAVLVTVQLTGLVLCPISWSHHWVWCLPAMIWLAHGPGRRSLPSRMALGAWAVVTAARVVPRLTRLQEGLGAGSGVPAGGGFPAHLALLGWVYVLCSVLTLLAVGAATADEPVPAPAAPPSPAPPSGGADPTEA